MRLMNNEVDRCHLPTAPCETERMQKKRVEGYGGRKKVHLPMIFVLVYMYDTRTMPFGIFIP
jgi:hypothetical protein